MLTELRLRNFKCFGDEVIAPLRAVTVLTGINGRGKSSLVQPLLCLSQSPIHTGRILLEGDRVDLGTFDDVRNWDRAREEAVQWGVEVRSPRGGLEHEALWTLVVGPHPGDTRSARLEEVRAEIWKNGTREPDWGGRVDYSRGVGRTESLASATYAVPVGTAVQQVTGEEPLTALAPLFSHRLRYVSADRLGPQAFSRSHAQAERLSVGTHGEHLLDVLAAARDDQRVLPESRCAPGTAEASRTLFDQASFWLNYVFDGAGLSVGEAGGVGHRLLLNTEGGARYHRAPNVGFGYAYVLPLIVEVLLAEPDDVVIMENPEAHLHPAAASRFGRFLAAQAGQGVQVIVETHSEHVLNGLRVAVKGGVLASGDDLSVLYFRKEEPPLLRVPVADDGRIAHWPGGFFDQAVADLGELHGRVG